MADDIGARVRAADNLADVIAELLAAGFGFSCLEDNDRAMEWALRAYRAGQAAVPDGPRTWQLPDGWAIGEVEYGAAHDASCEHWDFGTASETREGMESWLADHEHWRLIARVRLVPLTDATPADGRVGGNG